MNEDERMWAQMNQWWELQRQDLMDDMTKMLTQVTGQQQAVLEESARMQQEFIRKQVELLERQVRALENIANALNDLKKGK